jgi:hypothetical protein
MKDSKHSIKSLTNRKSVTFKIFEIIIQQSSPQKSIPIDTCTRILFKEYIRRHPNSEEAKILSLALRRFGLA